MREVLVKLGRIRDQPIQKAVVLKCFQVGVDERTVVMLSPDSIALHVSWLVSFGCTIFLFASVLPCKSVAFHPLVRARCIVEGFRLLLAAKRQSVP